MVHSSPPATISDGFKMLTAAGYMSRDSTAIVNADSPPLAKALPTYIHSIIIGVETNNNARTSQFIGTEVRTKSNDSVRLQLGHLSA